MPRWTSLLAALLAFCPIGMVRAETPHAPTAPATVILISIDGFRTDYVTRGVTPNLLAMVREGVRAEAMRPSFPSVTFPNHYTLVTGLRPDRNGIVSNTMEDPAIPGATFKLSDRNTVTDRRWWDEAEPVWVTAEKHGVRSATMFWPGSEADIHGVRPQDWRVFDGKVSNDARVDTVLGWLDRPAAERPRLITLYFDEVDHSGHEFGPDSQEVNRSAASVDEAIGRLRNGLRARGLSPDIIVVSDHGMAPISADRVIPLDTIVPEGSYHMVTGGPYAGLNAKPGQEEALAAALLKPQAHMQCWRKAEIPERLHYGHNPRVAAFVCLAETGWFITEAPPQKPVKGGAHGYDPAAPEMAASFIAAGPDFRPGIALAPFDNVDVYPLVMKLIGVPAEANDGTLATFTPALRVGQP